MNIHKYIQSLNPYIADKFEKKYNDRFCCILYGAGEKGKHFLDDIDSSYVHIQYYCDDDANKWGSSLNGIEVISPFELIKLDPDIPIFITSKHNEKISIRLKSMGFQNIFHRFALPYLFSIDMLQKAYDLLYDNKSREVFSGLIEYVFTLNPRIFRNITTNGHQYFDKDIFEFSDNEIIVDGGAYIGDTIRSYIEISKGGFEKIYCFEPDSESYIRLCNRITQFGKISDKVEAFNVGLYSRNGKACFSTNHDYDSCIVDASPYLVDVVSIDEKLKDKKVTMIKMDIEGSEAEAILGARQVIRDQQPKLAVCNYHLSSDLWRIVLLINEVLPSYKIFMRHYDNQSWYETVVYAKI